MISPACPAHRSGAWALRMQWEGLSRVEIADPTLDPARNGGRSLAETVKHLTEHELVLWGAGRGCQRDAAGKPPVPERGIHQSREGMGGGGGANPEQ